MATYSSPAWDDIVQCLRSDPPLVSDTAIDGRKPVTCSLQLGVVVPMPTVDEAVILMTSARLPP